MCGITGVLHLDSRPADPAVLGAMERAIAHRGPDGSDVWTSGPVGFGHRRLAIIDLTDGGRQPMHTEDGRFTIIYNGELYNYRELRETLIAAGERFSTASDTEVVLKAFRAWGDDCLPRLNGMFAFAVWDDTERTLTVARDRYGVKPLYYMVSGGAFMFGSEAKAIFAHPSARASLDVRGLREYLTFQNFFSDRTLFSGVRLLPPGSVMRIRPGSETPEAPRVWWRPRFAAAPTNKTERELAGDVLDLFRQAVTRQLVADVDVGCYLSGGLDSGSVTAVAASVLPYARTFTCGFDLSSASGLELYFDERRDAEMMSYRFGTEHYEMVLKSGDMERAMPGLVRHLEEPRVGQSYPNFLIARLASRFNKVVLSGTGGDELFGGYPWRYQSVLSSGGDLVEGMFAYWQRVFPGVDHARLLAPVWDEARTVDPIEILRAETPELSMGADREETINAIMSFEARTFLHGLLVVEDKVSMAHSLEVRVPFLDNDLVDFALQLPPRYKIGGLDDGEPGVPNGGRTVGGKRIYRQAMESLIPSEIVHREKQGFSAPDASWFKGESIDFVRRRIGTPDAAIYRLLDFNVVKEQLDSHLEGHENKRLMIWSLLHLEEALEHFGLA